MRVQQIILKVTRSICTTASTKSNVSAARRGAYPLLSANRASATSQPRSRILTCIVSGTNSRTLWRNFGSTSFLQAVPATATELAGKFTECDKMTADKIFNRLPKNVKPRHYKIHLTPDIKRFTFTGEQQVFIDVIESTNSVTFNSVELDIKSVFYDNGHGKTIQSKAINLNAEDETATVVFSESLPLGKSGFLSMEFSGEINDKLKGFHRSKYTLPDGTTKFAAVTQFESTDARRCIPCWDEPALKATFEVSLTVPSDLVAVSNMPVKSTKQPSPNLKHLVFETSPIMSTYLVAMVIGEFDYIEDRDKDGVLVRVYTPKGKQEQGKFALDVATKTLPYYKSYFDIPYPLPKMDLVAIADFQPGAMENWGLVTYRETCLLVDPKNTSALNKQFTALVVGHELAHQWFGNLVTMEWWTHLWLNEGYASFVEFLCVDYLFPEYDIWTQFVTQTHIRALELDALKNSHPIEVPVGHPSEIDEIFDDISYCKGGSVIRMLHSYIGDDDFRKGMSLYLKKYSYSNAETEDLWDSLEKASKKPIQQIMSTWTKQQGYPLVKVSEKPSADPNKRVFSFSQSTFLADGSVDPDNKLWSIPISISILESPKNSVKNVIMDTKTMDIEIEGVPKTSWIKVNPNTVGVYRTMYDNDLLEKIIPAIQNQSLPPLDRLGLLDDLFAASQAGHISLDQVLKLLKAYENENNFTVWNSIINSLNKTEQLLSHLEIYSKYKMFGRSLLKNVYNRIGWEKKANESHSDTLLRSLILNRMISFNNEDAIKEALQRFEDHVSGKELSADLRNSVYRAVMSVGDANTLETMLKLYRATDLSEEKERILLALGSSENETILKQVLDFSLTKEVNPQNTVLPICAMAVRSYKGRVLAWQFFKDNYQTYVNRFEKGYLLNRLVKGTSEHFVTESYAKDIEEFFKSHPTPGAERNIQQSIETVRLNAAWLKRDEKAIESFFFNFI